MDKQIFGILALFIFASPFIALVIIAAGMNWLKKTRAFRKRIQAQTAFQKASEQKFRQHSLQEWVTVGDYDVFVHRLTGQGSVTGAETERILYVEVEYRNQSGQESLSCRRNQWHLFAEDGYSYEALSEVGASHLYEEKKYFGGDRFINPSMHVRGWLAFRVPVDAKIELLQFMTAFLGTKTAEFRVGTAVEEESPGHRPGTPTPEKAGKHTIDERNVNPITEMSRIAHDLLALPSRGFQESYRSAKTGTLIFDSEWCRLSLVWGGWDYLVGNSISIYYGRLHAPSDEHLMIWNDEICHAWHDDRYVMHFLDGHTPAEAADTYSHPVTDPFYQEEICSKYRRQQPDWLAQMNLAIWKHYGTRLFEVFDLRHPELWQQYRQYLKDVYDAKGRLSCIDPPLDVVC